VEIEMWDRENGRVIARKNYLKKKIKEIVKMLNACEKAVEKAEKFLKDKGKEELLVNH
jgi:hypothetical protein